MGARLSECRLCFNRLNDDISVVRRVVCKTEYFRDFAAGNYQSHKKDQNECCKLAHPEHCAVKIHANGSRVKPAFSGWRFR